MLSPDRVDADQNKVWGILAYILFLIPLIGAPKNSRYARFHTNQGLVLVICSVAGSVALNILTALAVGVFSFSSAAIAVVGILSVVSFVFGMAVLGLAIFGIVNAVQGKMQPLPVIGKWTILK
jgi:uncharacterized membrane protein